jgi:hypothetical protein
VGQLPVLIGDDTEISAPGALSDPGPITELGHGRGELLKILLLSELNDHIFDSVTRERLSLLNVCV